MVAALGDRPVVLLRGHGLTSVTISVQQAVLQAISVDRLARLSLRSSVPAARSPICPAPALAELPGLGSSFNVATAWRHELARTRR
jgi:ribulose-5-phosphate 4-epimerase/fuculose-1-phosphate aldolase